MKTIIIGISDRTLRFLGLNEKKEISFIESVDTTFSFTDCFKTGAYEDTLVNEASYVINNILRDVHTSATKIGVIIESSFAFLNIVPIDYNESASNISSWILWDLSNYFPDNYKNFKVNYYKLHNKKFDSNVNDTLIVSFDKVILQVLVKIFYSGRLKFQLFDIDHFAAEKYLRTVFEEKINKGCFLVIGCKRNHIDISFHHNEELVYYDYLIFKDSSYKTKLKDKITSIPESANYLPVKYSFVYGEDYSEDIYHYLSNELKNIEFYIPDPNEEFKMQDHLKKNNRFKNEGNKFIPLFGLALKCL
ncbi:MAG: pilus assembly protein PilM [Ignavibacteria bacterium]|nr:pilus assembly protein PilM [Ignavibacteria bacterium]